MLPTLQTVEVHLSQFNALRRRMISYENWEGIDDFVTRLLIDNHVSLPGGSHTPAGIALLRALEGLSVSAVIKVLLLLHINYLKNPLNRRRKMHLHYLLL